MSNQYTAKYRIILDNLSYEQWHQIEMILEDGIDPEGKTPIHLEFCPSAEIESVSIDMENDIIIMTYRIKS